MSEPQAALWYWVHGSLQVDVYDTERQAAQHSMWMEDAGDWSTIGVQLADGTLHEARDWPALKAVEEEERQRWRAEDAERRRRPLPAVRDVASPWPDRDGKHRRTRVLADTPRWVGRGEQETPK